VLIEKLQATIVVLSATNTLNIDVGALYCCVLLVATGCVEVAEAYRAVDGRVMLAVVFAFGVSSAMETSGVAGLIARKIVDAFAPLGPTGIISAVCVIACVVGSGIP